VTHDDRSVGAALRPTVQMLTIPNGFTLTIGSVLAISVGSDGYPGWFAVWLFVVGGCLGFCLMGVLSTAHRQLSKRAGPANDLAVFNLVPVAVVPVVYAATHWLTSRPWQFAAAGFLAVTLYIAGYSASAWWARRMGRRKQHA
jgi:hypothetical protein